MSIYPEKRNGKLTGRLRVEVQRHGRTIVKFATSQKDAKRLQVEMKAGLHDNPDKPALSADQNSSTNGLKVLYDQVDELWAGTGDFRQSTRRANAFLAVLREVMRDMGVPDDLRAIKTAHISEVRSRLRKGRKNATVNRHLNAGSKLFAWAARQDHIDALPFFDLYKEEKKPAYVMSPEDEQKLRECLKGRGHEDCLTLMDVQLATGCRISEVMKRTPRDLSDDGDGFWSMDLGLTKNGKERVVVMPAELGARFKALLEAGLPKYRSVWQRIKYARKACGLPQEKPTHTQRHTAATRLARQGVNALDLQDFMGHSSLNTTRLYVHNDTATKKRIAKTIMRRPAGYES